MSNLGQLTLTLTDAATDRPIQGRVDIHLSHLVLEEARELTDVDATEDVVIERLQPGLYAITISARGYCPETPYVAVDERSQRTFRLEQSTRPGGVAPRGTTYDSAIAEALVAHGAGARHLMLEDEVADRPVRKSRCTLLTIDPRRLGISPTFALSSGTATAFIARKGDRRVDALEEALRAGDACRTSAALTAIRATEDDFGRSIARAAISQGSACETPSPAASAAFAELRYADRTLVRHVMVSNDLPMGVQVFPYNGGRLDDARFELVEHCTFVESTPLHALVVIHPPELSAIEKEALSHLPSGAEEVNIGSAMRAFTPIVAAGAVWLAEAVAAGAVGWAVGKMLDRAFGAFARLPDQVLNDPVFRERLRTLPAEASARELLALRRHLLLNHGARRETRG